MMKTTGVKPAEWTTFFDGFSRRHQGRMVRLLVLDPKLGAQVEALQVPLQGVVADHQNRGITIQVGERQGGVAHTVHNPRRVWVEVGNEGFEAAVEIESADGTKSIVEFQEPAPH